ncbi:MAG TPA: HAD-IIB family hydrolase [Desulfobacteraceae bacterium]|nr:HAD-IIB family hydrolase [Desulfobacteraceae bacterium]
MDLPLLIFTDLDGTLLDHHTYSFQGAEQTLRRLRECSIPLILTSSKTRTEILKLQERLGLNEPFISENGGGIFFPPGHALSDVAGAIPFNGYRGVVFGRPYAVIRGAFADLRRKFHVRGFGDMTVDEIMHHTGLNREEATLAAQRDFTEPFLFPADARSEEMAEAAAAAGLAATRGGRFLHLMGAGQDKGRAVAEATRLFQEKTRGRIITVGLGDAPNDLPMLQAVEIPVLLPGPDSTFADMDIPGLRLAPFPGSRGWGMIVASILDEVARQRCDDGNTGPRVHTAARGSAHNK